MTDASIGKKRDALTELEDVTLALAARSQWEQDNRRALLWVHSAAAIITGIQILLFGGPGNVERSIGLWTRPALGILAIVGGVLLGSGLMARPRSIPREIVGLVVVGLWDLSMTLGIVSSRVSGGSFAPLPLGEPQPLGYAVSYPITVYGCLLVLILIHLLTLLKLSRPRRRLLWISPR